MVSEQGKRPDSEAREAELPDNSRSREDSGSTDDPALRWLQLAGPRPDAPRRALAEIKRTAYPAWQEKVAAVAKSRRQRRGRILALAASVLLSVSGILLWRQGLDRLPEKTEGPRVATVEIAHLADYSTSGQSKSVLTADMTLSPGSTVETGADGWARLSLSTGSSVRLGADTTLRINSTADLALLHGAVYMDTGPAVTGTTVAIETPFGIARDIGTQFEVRLLSEGLRVQVREGEVEVDLGDTTHSAPAGTLLTIDKNGIVEHEDIPHHGTAWSWILDTSPVFELEGRNLGEFLDWVARETGWQLSFSDPQLEREVRNTIGHGSLGNLRPDQALSAVLTTSGFDYRLIDGTVVIGRSPAP